MVSKTYDNLGYLDNLQQILGRTNAIGFDRQIMRFGKTFQDQSTGFPPYNIQKVEDFKYSIELALAGFTKDDIEIEFADGVLTVRSVKESKEVDDEWTLHRGISYRKFNRKFTLSDDVVVNGAKLENGLLTIELEQIVPEEKKPRLITIK